ncbi:MAG: VOC family protein [Deltaproteobacteria bacterium]|nr:MAG: VOC family protein [Deltaproteobacteria bacterium]
MPEKPVFTGVMQVGLVVKDLNEAMKRYWEIYGIGPWMIYTYGPDKVKDMTVRNKRVEFVMKVAFAFIGNIQWELIQPLDDNSIYAEYLKKHGEGLHHVACAVGNHNETVAYLQDKGIGVLQSGTTTEGSTFTYLDTQETMSCITEIFDVSEGGSFPPPEGTYP